MSQSPNDVKDYTTDSEMQYNHYNGVSSWYGRLADEQCRMQPKYCEPGPANGAMSSEKRNTQLGPKL